MFGSKISIDKELLKRAKAHASKAGYSSVEEFVAHLIERELSKLDDAESKKEIEKKLKGLGYIS